MPNPTIKELNNEKQFELLAELNHQQIKEFVVNQFIERGWLAKWFMVYQTLMLTVSAFIVTLAVIRAFKNNYEALYYIAAALAFCFSFLIVGHELLHGIAMKICGVPKIHYGTYFKKFIFYAEADQHVLNKKQFAFIALAPLVVVQFITIVGIIVFFNTPLVFFVSFTMCIHCLFCAGDIGLLSLFYKHEGAEIFTYDVRIEKKSYYFKKK